MGLSRLSISVTIAATSCNFWGLACQKYYLLCCNILAIFLESLILRARCARKIKGSRKMAEVLVLRRELIQGVPVERAECGFQDLES